MSAPESEKARRFYNSNTSLFLNFGHSSGGSIHRAVWAENINNREAALHYVDEQLCRHLRTMGKEQDGQIIDLGCGVGASLCYIANNLPVTGLGITISDKQVQLATSLINQHNLQKRIACIQGDYCDLPEDLPRADLIFAIESFVHGENPASFFEQAAKLMKPGARLLICDDFINDTGLVNQAQSGSWIERFKQGWLIGSLLTADETDELATQHELRLIEDLDLSPWLELDRPRDKLIALLMKLLGKSALNFQYLRMLYGGNALQYCLQEGWLAYRLLVWEKPYE
tara:strand:- start:377 stop:1231 length:855 start_codon:yes stop_codon:yes gene_type:complete